MMINPNFMPFVFGNCYTMYAFLYLCPFFSQKTEKTEFLSFFYKYCMHVLTAPLLANTAHDKTSKGM